MKKKHLLILLFLVLVGGIVFFFRNGQFKEVTLDAFYPILKTANVVEEFFETALLYFKSQNSLIEENQQLHRKMELLKAHIIQLKKLEIENKELKRILNFIDKYPEFDLKIARVIGYSPDNWSNFIIIDAGSFDGIKKGDIVVSDGFLLGQIYQVGAFSSSVVLVSDKNFKISARCRKTREFVFFQGKNREEGRLIFVRPEQDIRIGDVIETDGLGKVPSGIPIGVVNSVSYVEGNFYKDVTVSLNLNPYNIEYVVIFSGRK